MKLRHRPVALIILDGWGYNENRENNAVAAANTPFFDRLFAENPNALVRTSGEAVGLPDGQMGTSEVGHLNIGAGRIVYQSLVRISKAIESGEIKNNKVFMDLIAYARQGKPLHVIGLVSPGGVHSHTDHLYGFLRIAAEAGLKEVYIHAFLDGRDTPPAGAGGYLRELENKLKEIGVGRIVTVAGRYYAMDRDTRWDRTEKAYAAMVYGEGEKAASALEAVENSYARGVTDEFLVPVVITENDRPLATVRPGDAVFFFNFRPDRARQITRAFVDRDFQDFERRKELGVKFACLTMYDETIKAPVIFPPEERMKNIFGEYLSAQGLKQLRIAETEKYAHVTYFFNGGEEAPFPGEERILVPSPKVATYDLKPEMSAWGVTERVLEEIKNKRFDVIVMNYANCDMVGHTGSMPATIKAVETVDACLAQVVPAILEQGGAVLISADHGNAELMVDPETGEPYTAHTTFPTPVILTAHACAPGRRRPCRLKNGILADLAPTVLALLGLPKPVEMTGESLIIDGSG